METAQQESDLLKCKTYLLVKSAILDGETVIFAHDKIIPHLKMGRYKGHIVYTVSELRLIQQEQPLPEMLRALHEIKKTFGGQYITTLRNYRNA